MQKGDIMKTPPIRSIALLLTLFGASTTQAHMPYVLPTLFDVAKVTISPSSRPLPKTPSCPKSRCATRLSIWSVQTAKTCRSGRSCGKEVWQDTQRVP